MYCTNPDCPDLKATGMPAEYAPGVTTCARCGAALVVELPETEQTEPPQQLELRSTDDDEVVHRTLSLSDVELIAAALDEAGIPHSRRTRHLSGLALNFGSVAPTPGEEHELLVPAEAAAEARELIEALNAPSDLEQQAMDEPPEPLVPEPGRRNWMVTIGITLILGMVTIAILISLLDLLRDL